MRYRKGFTLVELLVVIGVIALLISILMPALNSARSAARLVQCQSNFKQVYNAVLSYVTENNGYLPPQSDLDWEAQGTNCETFIRLNTYLGQPFNDPNQIRGVLSPVFTCVEAIPPEEAGSAWAPQLIRTIQFNPRAFPGWDQMTVSAPGGATPGEWPLRKMTSIRKSAEKVMFYEATQIPGWNYSPEPESIFLDGWRWNWSHMYMDPPPASLSGAELTRYNNNDPIQIGSNVDNGWWACSMRFRHKKNTTNVVAFFDGHVETRTLRREVDPTNGSRLADIKIREICINRH
jgi:prepilin-type N-terminal cleavage/methylation domain-containing protein/prepilin-type processing-associated H-X9-DG protein